MDLSRESKMAFLKQVDLNKTEFEVKIADFGLSARCPEKQAKLS